MSSTEILYKGGQTSRKQLIRLKLIDGIGKKAINSDKRNWMTVKIRSIKMSEANLIFH